MPEQASDTTHPKSDQERHIAFMATAVEGVIVFASVLRQHMGIFCYLTVLMLNSYFSPSKFYDIIALRLFKKHSGNF